MGLKPSKRERLKAFILQRKLNALGLLVITLMSAIITLICALSGFHHTDILVVVTALLIVLCFIQSIKMKKSFRTIRHFKGSRHRARNPISTETSEG